MKTAAVTKNGSLLTTAFEILLRQLGPQKANRLWQILTPSKINYMKVRQKLFKGKDLETLYKEAKDFAIGPHDEGLGKK